MTTITEHLTEITQEQAAALLQENSTVIYIREGILPVNTSHNTIALSGKTKDASLNMYMYGQTPAQVGLSAIVEWMQERTLLPLSFFTYYSDKFLMI